MKLVFVFLVITNLFASDFPSDSLYNLDSTWKNREGKQLKLDTYKGSNLVISMVYLSCPQTCPLLVSDLKRIESSFDEKLKSSTKFLLVSFDPEKDTPNKMLDFSKKHHINRSSWDIVTGSATDIRKLSGLLNVSYKKNQKEYSHSALITVLDAKGVIKKQFEGSSIDPSKVVEALK